MDYKICYTNTNGREMTIRHDFTNNETYVFHESIHSREQVLSDSMKKHVYSVDEMSILLGFTQTLRDLKSNSVVRQTLTPEESLF